MNEVAIEKFPSLDDLLGNNDKAEEDARLLRNLALSKYNLSRSQIADGLKDTDAVPGFRHEEDGEAEREVDLQNRTVTRKFRSFAQQRRIAEEAAAEIWKRAAAGGYNGLVQQKLDEQKS